MLLRQIDKEYECDTFFPAIDASRFKLWSASPAVSDGDVSYTFLCYTTSSPSDAPSAAAVASPAPAGPVLPPATASRHEEYQVRPK